MTEAVETDRMPRWLLVVTTVCGTIFALVVLSCATSPFVQGFVHGFFR